MTRNASGSRRILLVAAGWAVVAVTGCARVDTPGASGEGGNPGMPVSHDASGNGGASGRDAAPVDMAPPKPPCIGLQCQQMVCPGGATTSVSGTVFAPNGKLPLYNVTVYVPNAPLDPFPSGITCDRCGAVSSGKPIVTALSNAEGKFKLTNVPVGANIPLVVQVGKWRRKVMLPNVTACQDNPLTDANLTRLPRNRKEGDMPKMAVTTGSCDQLGCLMPKLGLDPAEFGVAGDDKAVIYYQGSGGLIPIAGNQFGPPNMRPATELWNDEASLSKHDLTLLSCECSENLATKTMASFTAMTNYIGKGGRIFGSHFSYVWLKNATDPALTAAVPIGAAPGGGGGGSPMNINTTFPKGKALADWMKFVAPTVTYGQIDSRQIFNNVRSVMPPVALAWASSPTISFAVADAGLEQFPRIVTVNAPAGLPADKQCGRAAHLDAHITIDDVVSMPPPGTNFPAACGTDLTKGETALAFLFFDLASCIQDDTVEPPIP